MHYRNPDGQQAVRQDVSKQSLPDGKKFLWYLQQEHS